LALVEQLRVQTIQLRQTELTHRRLDLHLLAVAAVVLMAQTEHQAVVVVAAVMKTQQP
jgi:hypothetical protein